MLRPFVTIGSARVAQRAKAHENIPKRNKSSSSESSASAGIDVAPIYMLVSAFNKAIMSCVPFHQNAVQLLCDNAFKAMSYLEQCEG